MKQEHRAWLGPILKIAVSAAILYWLIGTGRLSLQDASALFRSPWLPVGLLLIGTGLFLNSERWRLLITSQSLPAGRWETFRLSLIGVFFNYAMPGGVGGDVVKAYYFSRNHPHSRATAVISVAMDRVLGLYAMILMAVAVMLSDLGRVLVHPTLKALLILLIALWFAASLGLTFVFSRRIHRRGHVQKLLGWLPFSNRLVQLYTAAHRFGLNRARIFAVLGMSLLAQSVSILFLWIAGSAAGYEEVPLAIYFLAAPVGYMATAIPISPAGIGVGQAAFLFLFNLYLGHDSPMGPAVITAQQAITGLFGLWGAWFYIRSRPQGAVALSPKESL